MEQLLNPFGPYSRVKRQIGAQAGGTEYENSIRVVLEYALGVGDEQNRILELLRKGPATSAELAQALGTSEPPVLNALDVLRTGRAVEFMAGEWSLAHVLDK